MSHREPRAAKHQPTAAPARIHTAKVYLCNASRTGGQIGQLPAAHGDFSTHTHSYFPPSKSTGSQNNTAKILPGLNPNLLKQVESLP